MLKTPIYAKLLLLLDTSPYYIGDIAHDLYGKDSKRNRDRAHVMIENTRKLGWNVVQSQRACFELSTDHFSLLDNQDVKDIMLNWRGSSMTPEYVDFELLRYKTIRRVKNIDADNDTDKLKQKEGVE